MTNNFDLTVPSFCTADDWRLDSLRARPHGKGCQRQSSRKKRYMRRCILCRHVSAPKILWFSNCVWRWDSNDGTDSLPSFYLPPARDQQWLLLLFSLFFSSLPKNKKNNIIANTKIRNVITTIDDYQKRSFIKFFAKKYIILFNNNNNRKKISHLLIVTRLLIYLVQVNPFFFPSSILL